MVEQPNEELPPMHKRVPEDADGVPRYSLLAMLARQPGSGIVQIAPGRYRTDESAPGPQG